MTADQDVAKVLQMVVDLEVEDVDRSELAALIRVAHRIDRKLNAQTVTNLKLYGDRYYLEPSRLAKQLGCSKADCKVCTKTPDRSVPAL